MDDQNDIAAFNQNSVRNVSFCSFIDYQYNYF